MRGPPLSLGFPGSSNRKGPVGRQAASSTQPGACPLPPPTVVWENSRFSGQAPGEILYPDRLLDSVASHCPREGQGGGTSLGGCGGGKAWGTWGGPGRGRKRPQSSHRHGPLPPGSLEHSRGRPPSPAGSTRPPGSPALPFPAQGPLPGWTCLWSGWGPWKPQPCGLGSPWLLGTFAPCPWVLARSPFGLTPTTEVSSHLGARQFSQTLPLRPVARRGLSRPHVPFPHGSGGKGRGAARVPAGQPLPLPRFRAVPPLC